MQNLRENRKLFSMAKNVLLAVSSASQQYDSDSRQDSLGLLCEEIALWVLST